MNTKIVIQISRCIIFYLVLIVTYLTCISQNAWAQSEQPIEFTKEFKFKKTDTRLPFGKKVLISGTVEPTVTSMTVYWVVNSSEAKTKANIKDGRWTAIVGPFPAGQSVIFRFEIISTLSEDERAQIKCQVQKALDNFVKKVFSEKIAMTQEEFKAYTELNLRKVMPKELKKFMSPTGESLYDVIIKEILSWDTKKLLYEVINKIAERNHITSTEIPNNIESLKKDFLKTPKFRDVLEQFSQEEKKVLENAKLKPKNIPQDLNTMKILSDAIDKSALTQYKKDELKKILLDIDVRQNDLRNIKEELGELIKDITDKVSLKISTFESAQIAQTTAEVSELEYYAGFDVAALIVPDEAAVSSFFTINIYTKRVEIDRDPKSLWDRLSITTGIGLTTSGIDSDGPVYYLGLGYRFNRYFRLTLGTTIFKKVDNDNFNYDFTFGVSLNFRFIGDIIKIFNSVLSSTPGQD